MSAIVTPFYWDLTPAALLAMSPARPPLVAGDDQVIRFQLRRNGAAQSLTGALVIWTMRLGPGSSSYFEKSSADGGIVFDADQVTEGEDEGKGWGGIVLARADQDALLAFCGAQREHDLRAKLESDSLVQTYGYGPIGLLRPRGLAIV